MSNRTRILVADDEPQVARTITKLLEHKGYECVTATTAATALELVAAQSFELLLSDICFPDDDKLGFLERLSEATKEPLPVVLMTGRPTVETAVRALRHGVIDYLAKPVAPEDLMACVERALEWRNAAMEVADAHTKAQEWVKSFESASRVMSVAGGQQNQRMPAPPMGGGNGHGNGHGVSPAVAKLTRREQEIVAELSAGLRVDQIAGSLSISPHTVRNHLKSIFRKLGVTSQVELLAIVRS